MTLLCQLYSAEDSFKSIVPEIAWGVGTQTFEFIEIRNQLNDGRYFGSHFPDPDAKNLIGNVVIRNFTDSDFQKNFSCTQTLLNGSRVEYALTISNEHTPAPPTASNATNHSYTNTAHPDTMHPPSCPLNMFLAVTWTVTAIIINILLSICLLFLVGVFRCEIKEKICKLKPRLLMSNLFGRREDIERVESHSPPDTMDATTNGDTNSESNSSQIFHSFPSETEDLQEAATLRRSVSSETPVKSSHEFGL